MKRTNRTSRLAVAALLVAAGVIGCKSMSEGMGKLGAELSKSAAASGNNDQTTQLVGGLGQMMASAHTPPEQEEAIGQSVAVALANQKGLSPDDALQEYINLVGMTVASVSDRPDMYFTFGVLNSDDVNAFSSPGGYVLITKGALRLMKDESELAGVLAHEVGHLCHQDGLKAIQGTQFYNGFAKSAAAAAGPRNSEIVKALTGSVQTVLGRTFTQSEEYAADAAGVKLLKDAGYDPHGLSRFIGRMGPEKLQAGEMPTHPRSADRIAKLTALAGTATGQTLADRFAQNVKLK